MDEDVFALVLRDKAEALLSVEELYGSLCHLISLLITNGVTLVVAPQSPGYPFPRRCLVFDGVFAAFSPAPPASVKARQEIATVMSKKTSVTTKAFSLVDLLEWFEALLDHRAAHVDSWFMFFATDERYVELHITSDEIWAGGVTNYNLAHDEWLAESDIIKLGVLGWPLEAMDSPEPKYVRRWTANAPRSEIVSDVLRVLTSIYLRPHAEVVEVMRGSFASGTFGWENAV
ncbi:MAG TPA: hypothetical protein VMZ22_12680 [Acidimicrobiales bacterium]|nr:hypothetical protein [Acidimicrobiales bacterium]